ncbi:NACHT and ankyrin domain protein [Colletotrichum plurivorum]|uniref:NACHT and ankyrin domain protein n=1 Tax=Colletotrichum plurivorum TaxID=2175906 RepID=A0A8H6JFY7_9PEZI|nr:NACHT and ankyrin domain protein [Colletotrichum plurivorum]
MSCGTMAPGFRDRIRRKFRREHGGQATATPSSASHSQPNIAASDVAPTESSIVVPAPYNTDPPSTQQGTEAETTNSAPALVSTAPDSPSQTATSSFEEPIEDPTALWARAFRRFREREPDLASDYTTHLTDLSPDATVEPNGLGSADSVARIVERLLASREEKQWKFSLQGRSINVRRQIEKLAKFLVWSDGVVKTAVSAQPHAALSWSAVSILLPLITVSTELNDAMLEGLESFNRIQVFWKMYEDSTSPNTQPKANDLLDLVVMLYSQIVKYHARVVCHLSNTQMRRAWDDIGGGNAWKSEAEKQSREILQNIYGILDDKTEREILEQPFADHETYKSLNPPRVAGTCEWFFRDSRFLDWRDSDSSRLLLVLAGPGSGKSVLSRALIDERRLSTSSATSTACFFFFKDGDKERMTCASALAALLDHLFTQDPRGRLIDRAKSVYQQAGKNLSKAPGQLWKVLLSCVKSPEVGEVICLIDALDECQEQERRVLIDLLKGFYGDEKCFVAISNLKFLVTNRPHDKIEHPFRPLLALKHHSTYIPFHGSDKTHTISQEINTVIDEKVRGLTGNFTEDDRARISDHLKGMRNTSHLWLRLVFQIIEDSPSDYSRPFDVDSLLTDLPTEVSDAYEKLLRTACNPKSQKKMELLFEILLAAGRPLRIDEVDEALTIALRMAPFGSYMEFKQQTWGLDGLGNFLALAIPDLCDIAYSAKPSSSFPLRYAVKMFTGHCNALNSEEKSYYYEEVMKLIREGPQLDVLLWYFRRDDSWLTHLAIQFEELGVACFLGLDFVVGKILSLKDRDFNINSQIKAADHMYGAHIDGFALIHVATARNHINIVKTLIKHGADHNLVPNKLHGSPLEMAMDRKHFEVAQVFLHHGTTTPTSDPAIVDETSFLKLLRPNKS